jgi:NADPH:quinone reductase-like Zn-dependent oxidoreductase
MEKDPVRSVRFSDFGIENLRVEEVDDPTAAAGEVVIAVEAATINPADAAAVSGAAAPGFPPSFAPPYTPGWDLSGRIVALGDGVDGSLLGARVVGFSLWFDAAKGTQSALVALPLENIAIAPEGLSSARLTTIGLNGLTAWRAVDEASVQPGETVVVTGAAGSVGGYALELLASRGIRVIGAVSERDRAAVLALGATDVVAREDGDLGEGVRKVVPGGADVLIDTASIAGPALAAIRDGGRFVTTTVLPEAERDISVVNIYGGPNASALKTLVDMAVAGTLHTPVAREFDVSDVQAAYAEFGAGSHRGRIVLTFAV